ncbi:MAG: response regulator [Acaryochloris sp. RU_4_1]|nr:response regulator [Acaryochloris sp. RU_4_1]NJR53318.1 response regulator [Acaryochloris sp. CRU_2_0]
MPKILLVEDNELNRDMLGRRLHRRGYEVVIAVDGAEGVSKATSEQPDLILMDMSLPVMNGWQATQNLKAGVQTASIPIIALTAHAMVGDQEKALAAGCDDYDTKPVDLKRLLQKIEKQLQAAQTRSTVPTGSSVAIPTASSVVMVLEQPVASPVTASLEPLAAIALEHEPPGTQANQVFTPFNVSPKLLVVDDNEANRDMLSRRLERKGFEVLLADSGESALAVLATTDVSLVLLDIMMPGIGGIETLRRIRQMYSQAQLPVIMATAKDTSEDIVEALELGANDYITKPIDLPVALARIQTHLKTLEDTQQQLVESSAPPQHVSFWNERYRLIEVLSRTSFSQTAIAQDLRDPDASMRLIHSFHLDTNNPDVLETVQEMFLAEMATLKQIKPHEQCIPLLSYLQDGEVFYLVHEYIEGTLLSKFLETKPPLSIKEICKLADELLTIVDVLHHSQMIHTHPHPGCFLRPSERNRKLILIDYGITTRLLSKLSQQYPQYQQALESQNNSLAPELLSGTYSPATDLYAIGKTLLLALSNQVGTVGVTSVPESDLAELIQETNQILQTMCEPKFADRYPSTYEASRVVRNHWHKVWKLELSIKSKQTH